MLQLHWSPKSPFVRKVMICIHELGIDHEVGRIRSVAAMLKPNATLMQDNPLSKIPTLVLDDGSSLFDSVVICEYLNDHAKGKLFPAVGPDKWQALRWHALGNGLMDALILWRNEREREVPLPTLMQAFEHKVGATLELLEAQVPELTAAPMSIGTVTLACALGYLDYRFDELGWRQRAPALAAWFAVWQQRPSFVLTEPVEG
jgi:glutathione S-transferase